MKFKAKYELARTPIMLLSAFQFTTMLTENSEERFANLEAGTLIPRSLGKIPGSKNRAPQFALRVFANKKTLIAAFRPERDLRSSCRLVDVLTHYFWRYRIREATSELERFNYSREQAVLDLKNEPGLVDTLADLEIAWSDEKAIPTLAELAEMKRLASIPKVKTSLRKELETLGHNVLPELRQGFLTLRAELNGIHEALNVDAAATAARIEKLEEAFKQMVVIMGNINAKIK
jgi:hypothetical protein